MKTISKITWEFSRPYQGLECMIDGCREEATYHVQIKDELTLNLCLCEEHSRHTARELLNIFLKKEGER